MFLKVQKKVIKIEMLALKNKLRCHQMDLRDLGK